MNWTQHDILKVLDASYWDGLLPNFDNEFLCLGASRVTLFRSHDDWGLVFDVFGYSPSGGNFVTEMRTFGSTICNVDENYRQRILAIQNPPKNLDNAWTTSFYPVDSNAWQNPICEWKVNDDGYISLRGNVIRMPLLDEYSKVGINVNGDSAEASELMRWLSEVYREDILCSEDELKTHLPEEIDKILVLDEWRHPEGDELPSELESFQQIAQVLSANNPKLYSTTLKSNNHWMNWLNSGVIK